MRIFARGELESLGGVFHAVAVATLDLPPTELENVAIKYLDGRHDRYDQTPEFTRLL